MRIIILFISSALLLNVLAFSTNAYASCSDKGKVIIGELKLLTSRNSRGKRIRRFYLLPKRKLCVVSGRNGHKSERYVRQLEIFPRNARASDLKKFQNLRVAIRGTIHRKHRSRDAVAKSAVILGAYDPRNSRFHQWRSLESRLAQKSDRFGARERYRPSRDRGRYEERELARRQDSSRQDLESRRNRDRYQRERRQDIEQRLRRENRQAREDERRPEENRYWREDRDSRENRYSRREHYNDKEDHYSRDDSSALTGLIRKSLREYPGNRQDYRDVRRKGNYTGNPVHGEILDFVTDDFLQFHQMSPADVVEFYAINVDYNGANRLERDLVVRDKFKSFRKGPRQRFKLYNRTLTIKRSSNFDDVFYVHFQYGVGRQSQGETIWVRKQAKLTLDMSTDYVQIRRENSRTIGKPQY